MANALTQQRLLSIGILASLACDFSLAKRLRFHKPIDAHDVHRATESNDIYLLRHISPKSSKSESSHSSKSSKSSGSKSAKKSSSSSKSSKGSSNAGHLDEHVSNGKSAKASYAAATDSFNEQLPTYGGSNDFGTTSIPNSGNSNDVVSTHTFKSDSIAIKMPNR